MRLRHTGGVPRDQGESMGTISRVFITLISLVSAEGLFFSASAWAMHITEGILPLAWVVFWSAVAVPFVAYGLYRLKRLSATDLSSKPFVGLIAAVVFILSCLPIPVPIAGTTSHPCGTGISGILLGPGISILIAAVVLLMQALFLAHGGLTTWGANIVSMGVGGSVAAYFIFTILRSIRIPLGAASFLSGLCADWATYAITAAQLAWGVRGHEPFAPLFLKILIAFMPTQLPLGILEGAMTAGMVVLLSKKRPDILVKMGLLKPGGVGG